MGLCALALAALVPAEAAAKPEPGTRRPGFRLFARSLGAMTINRVYCGLASTGEVCVDSTNSSTIGGGFWPKGTPNQYVFNSGLQAAGIIGADGGPWAGDTTGAFFFDPKGTTQHGEEVQPIYNANNPADVAAWPEAAMVPVGDDQADLFQGVLQGRVSASQGDVWWLSWDGNPSLVAGRPHPLGILVEQRGLGWNFPSGNEDIIYFIYTFYNVTSANPATYAGQRSGMREILAEKGAEFVARNEAAFGVDLPDDGYTIENFYANFAADMDVADAGVNYASVSVPFALGHTYVHDFAQPAGWQFDPSIFGAPFFAGPGFVGVKYLASPEDPVTGDEVGLTLFSNTSNGGTFGDPQNTTQLWRYISGNVSTAAGDQACNFNQVADKICFINNGAPFDMRFFQSSGPFALGPGESGSVVVAYIFAAPVPSGRCPGASCDERPNDPRRMSNLATANNVNSIDTIAGYTGFAGDLDGNGQPDQGEFTVVPNSLFGKAKIAQTVFDGKFLLPFAPEAPDFFLIPGDNQVTVLWRPSSSETTGDPFFAIASQPTLPNPDTGVQEPNPLFDPNFRQFDVEGYRIYRGRVDDPAALTLLAQFDYAGTFIRDFRGTIAADQATLETCAPELGITAGCAVPFDTTTTAIPVPFVDVPLVGPIFQVKPNQRVALATGTAFVTGADTAVSGASNRVAGQTTNFPDLEDTGVPFVYVDRTARNNLRYFYSVTAFDVNSFKSGPATIESNRVTKSVTPVRPASNYVNTATLTTHVVGRGVAMDTIIQSEPTIDPATGRFSGPFPPANGATLGFVGEFVRQVVAAPGNLSMRLDSLHPGHPYGGIPHTYFVTAGSGGNTTELQISVLQDVFDHDESGEGLFDALTVDPGLAARYGATQPYTLKGQAAIVLPGNYYTNSFGRGCVNSAEGFAEAGGCEYNGSRWFNGPSPQNNETKAHPIEGNTGNFTGAPMTNLNNAGALTGVVTVHQTQSYQSAQNTYRNVEGIGGGAKRAADFNVYWGAGGTIDSVIDATHNVVVPFDANRAQASWGILNQSAAQPAAGSPDGRAELTTTDMGCVEPYKSFNVSPIACGAGPTYTLSQTAVPGPIALFSGGTTANAATAPVAANPGFVMYVSGEFFIFELEGGAVPAQGTVWTLRQYTGAISGGQGAAGDRGPYVFTPAERPFSAVGAEIQVAFDVVNQVRAANDNDLSRVHTVPDPYYVTSQFEQSTDTKVIKFVNLPKDAIVRIYSSSGVLVALLEHHSQTFGGEMTWNVRNRNNQVVASGVYFYHVESGDARRVGRFTVVNFAQ